MAALIMCDPLPARSRAAVPLTHQNPSSLRILKESSEMWKDQELMTELNDSEVTGRCNVSPGL